MFAAVVGIQASEGNPYPQWAAWIVLTAQLVAPILALAMKYLPDISQGIAVIGSVAISYLTVILVTRPIVGYSMQAGGQTSTKLKIASVLFASIVVIAVIARFSPELSVLAYAAYCFIPLQRLLKLSIHRVA